MAGMAMAVATASTEMERERVWREFQAAKAADARRLFEERGVVSAADWFEIVVDEHRGSGAHGMRTGAPVIASALTTRTAAAPRARAGPTDASADAVAVEAVDSAVKYSYGELDAAACQVAHWALAQGLQQRDVVALMMENRPEFLAVTMGLAKIGVTVALINISLTSALLAHAVTVAAAKLAIVSAAQQGHWQTATALLQAVAVARFEDLPLASFPTERPSRALRSTIKQRDPLYYIYTSGTTGPSKAALFSHLRFIGCALTWARPCGLQRGDRYYVTLPLFHGNAGCVAVAAAYFAGATVVLRRKFSASAFLADIVQHRCTAVAYIGELWRYVQLQPPSPLDRQHQIKVIVGNGLRASTWTEIVDRFGIPLVVEHYGSTEMPGDAVLNYFNVPGSCGYVPPAVWADREAKVVRYDVQAESVVRNEDGMQAGRCIECRPGEPGEIVFKLPGGTYDGYVGREATMRKLYRDVFAPGDTWWSSGDLLRIDASGFFYFVDRTGDTFRWKGENVSTNDVCGVLQSHPAVAEANVFGVSVPGNEGKAGMASLTLSAGAVLDAATLASLYAHVAHELPAYARPLFLRVRADENDKTATYKFQKYRYSLEGFDPAQVGSDRVYFADRYSSAAAQERPTYTLMDTALHQSICTGAFRL